ncbi:MAG: zinc-binding dehydrogenase, partial [Spirochaetota bacterium]
MKAMIVEQWGGPEVFQPKELPQPTAGPGEVVIRVAATSVNPVDYKIRRGLIGVAPSLPAVLHSDVSGVVEAVGKGVDHLVAGDEVYAFAGGFQGWHGALAEYMATDARLVAKKPASLSFREAAAVPLVGITAWLALVDRARLAPSDHVLVHAGAGGVGHVAVQIAKAVGARVATTVSTPAKRDLVSKLGANDVIMYRDESVEDYVNRLTAGRGFDVVFDTVGGDNVGRSMEAARVSGHVLGIALRTDANLALIHQKNLTLSGVFMV